MRVILPKKLDSAKLEAHEALFVELWYSMTHMRSLDSYRVKCMNSRTIMRELAEELRIGHLSPSELQGLCAEALEILDGDEVLKENYPLSLATVKPFLENPPVPDKKNKKDEAALRHERAFLFAAEDFAVSLKKDYFDQLCNVLPEVVRSKDAKRIHAVTAALLTDLVDQGWTLASLNLWHKVFLPLKGKDAFTFSKNLDFMLKQLSRGVQKFQVILKFSGTDKLKNIRAYGDFAISESADFSPTTEAEERFCKLQAQTTFAACTIEAVDHVAAAIEARSSFGQLIDLLRFDFARSLVRINETCYVRRDDGRVFIPRITHAVPNPVESVDPESFLKFVETFDNVLNSPRIEESSRRQLQAAVRQYRFGRDSEGYKDKFLNWWMGLEALCHVQHGKSIGEAVTHNVSRAMMKKYFFRLLRDLLTTLKYCAIEWPELLAEHTGCKDLEKLSVRQLLDVLQSKGHQEELWKACGKHPTLAYYGPRLGACFLDTRATLHQLDCHLKHLEWHVTRLWRIRCCIVHGSPIRFRLGLLSANLEFYLKQVILFAFESFREHDHVRSLADLFLRSSIEFDRLTDRLAGTSADDAEVRSAVFAEAVTRG